MYRSMMQVFVKESDKALEFYKEVFTAAVLCVYPAPNGTLYHAELDVYGQVLALSELNDESVVTGNTMMFCLHFGEGNEDTVRKIYDALKVDAITASPLEPCDYSPLDAAVVDKFGVSWCIFV